MSLENKEIIAVWKPKGPSSFRIVAEIRKITGVRKVGHAGTLDPLAQGVLVVGIGREGTKQFKHLVDEEKEYQATIKLGEESTTDDEEGEKTKHTITTLPSRGVVEKTIQKFVGNIGQLPPMYSALKIKGKPAYKLARQGKPVPMTPRNVVVKKIIIEDYHWPFLKLTVVTGPGVYIRSLARDIGKELQTGGYITALTRSRVGNFTEKDCWKPNISELKSTRKSKVQE